MADRISGEMLASSDSVAMTPTTQPAAAGTHRKPEVGRALAGVVRVIGSEDIRSSPEIGRYQTGPGVLLSRPVAGLVGGGTGLAERQLQRFQPVAHRTGVRTQVLGGRGDQSGQRGDQAASFVEVAVGAVVGVADRTDRASRPRRSSASPPSG